MAVRAWLDTTAKAVSGTAEEIQRAVEAGKFVHVWFSDEPIRRDVDLNQLEKLNKFREELEGKGLLGTYSSPADLAYQVRTAVEHDVAEMGLGAAKVRRRGTEHAMPRGFYNGNKRLIIENKSEVIRAEQLTWELADDDHFKSRTLTPVDIPPLGHMDWAIWPLDIRETILTIRWSENGEAQEERHSISF